MNPPPQTGEVWSVTAVTQQIQVLFAEHFPPLWIEGEVSNYSRSAAGHRYFTLKDDRNQIKAALFRNRARGLKFEPADGQKILLLGTIEVYGPRSEYQIIVQQVFPVGVGELELALRKLHARLEQEGLFAAERKRPLPPFPRRIGVVTSPRGAAIRDILKTLKRRAPQVRVTIAPTRVQGEGAAAEIARAIEAFNRVENVDLLIVGRGGGSLEDLWPFNEEVSVRAVAASRIPVIAAVGHEIDTTLSCLAADMRAPTPTAAAELAIRDRREWLAALRDLRRRLLGAVAAQQSELRADLTAVTRRYGFRRPQDALRTFVQTTDTLGTRLVRSTRALLLACHRDWTRHSRRTVLERPEVWLGPRRQQWQQVVRRLGPAWPRTTATVRERYLRAAEKLTALSPQSVLDRGFALLLDPEDRIIDSVSRAAEGMRVTARLADGTLHTRVETIETDKAWS